MKKDHIKTHTISVLKITALFLILVLLLASCGTVPKNNSNGAAPEPEKELNFSAQYAYTQIKRSDTEGYAKPKVVLIDSKKDLEEYYQNNKDRFDFDLEADAEKDFRAAGFVSFEEAIAKYDAEWFGSKQLLLVITNQPSSVTTFKVTKVLGHPDDSVVINIDKVGISESMQTSHIIIEVDKEFGADDLIDARVYSPSFLQQIESAATYTDDSGKVVLRMNDQVYELSGDIRYIYSLFGSDLHLWGNVREGDAAGLKTFSYGIKTFVYVRIEQDQVKLSKTADFSGSDVLTLHRQTD